MGFITADLGEQAYSLVLPYPCGDVICINVSEVSERTFMLQENQYSIPIVKENWSGYLHIAVSPPSSTELPKTKLRVTGKLLLDEDKNIYLVEVDEIDEVVEIDK